MDVSVKVSELEMIFFFSAMVFFPTRTIIQAEWVSASLLLLLYLLLLQSTSAQHTFFWEGWLLSPPALREVTVAGWPKNSGVRDQTLNHLPGQCSVGTAPLHRALRIVVVNIVFVIIRIFRCVSATQ